MVVEGQASPHKNHVAESIPDRSFGYKTLKPDETPEQLNPILNATEFRYGALLLTPGMRLKADRHSNAVVRTKAGP